MPLLVLISDTHCQHDGLDLPEGDILIHAGDWTGRGSESQTVAFLKWFEARPHKHKLFIAGNHDFFPERNPTLFRELVSQYAPSCHYLEDSGVTLEGYKFYGSPITPWFYDWAFNRHRGDAIRKHWDAIPDDVEVLVTHGPIHGIGDKLSDLGSEPGEHVGCEDLANTIHTRLHDLKLHVFGHIHEGAGIYQEYWSTFVNASVLDDRYRMRHKPTVFDLPDKAGSDPKPSCEQEGKEEA